ncbi:AvrD family protein [Rhodococcus aetherivorans]|uniref:AvrD family protein n=1 Tax=Rhodococcus aetherivorans TaxID=191292 RepID=UPI00388E30A9
MAAAVAQGSFTLDSPSRYLGPAEDRFFGAGYRRVRQNLRFAGLLDHPATGIRANAGVECPSDWSTKGTTAQRPHLSTIDVLLVATRAAGAVIGAAYGLDEADLAAAWVRSVVIRAAAAPVEHDLGNLDVTAEHVRSEVEPGRAEHAGRSACVDAVRVRVAGFAVELEVVHPGVGTPASRLDPAVADRLLAHAAGPYADGYRTHEMRTQDIRVDGTVAHARSRLVAGPGDGIPGAGLAARYEPHVTLVDAFVETLQLGQILMYELDGIDRATSNTLWMRRTVLHTADPAVQTEAEVPVTVTLEALRSLARGGALWRACDIVSERNGTAVRCSVAHELPATAAGSDLR